MRPPLLVLLTFAVATAPVTAVRVVDVRAANAQADQKQHEEQQQQQKKRAPAPTELKRLTPSQTAGSGGATDDHTGPGERPELAPALYARRLPAAPRIAEPSSAPPRAHLVSGHLSLPPPLS